MHLQVLKELSRQTLPVAVFDPRKIDALRALGRLEHIAATARVLDHLNRLLASDAPETELAAIGPDDLRRRLERAPPRGPF